MTGASGMKEGDGVTKLRDLEAAATKGPWFCPPDPDNDGHVTAAGPLVVDVFSEHLEADAAFILAWRNAAQAYFALEDAARELDAHYPIPEDTPITDHLLWDLQNLRAALAAIEEAEHDQG